MAADKVQEVAGGDDDADGDGAGFGRLGLDPKLVATLGSWATKSPRPSSGRRSRRC